MTNLILLLFFVFMIIIGIWGMKKTSSLSDFFIGGRNIGPWISAFAYGTTYFSAVLFIGFAGKLGWGFGLNALWIALGNTFIGSLLAWLVLGKRTRTMSKNLEVMTMPEFLQARYGGKYIKLIGAAVIFIFLIPYTASVFKGLSYLFEAYFNIPYDTILIAMVLITGIYLIMGGYFAVTLTDLIQGSFMLFGSVAMVLILANKAGGFPQCFDLIQQKYTLHVPAAKQPSILLLGSLVFMTSFGVWGMPQMIQKFYAIKNEGLIRKAAIATCIFSLIISFSAYFIGALSHVFLDAPPMVGGKPAFDRIIPGLLTTNIPPSLLILILLLILSASMSTLSSLVLVSASAVAIDIYKGHMNPNVTKEKILVIMRVLTGVFVILAYFTAKYDLSIIVTLMSLSWGTVAGGFMGPYIHGLYNKTATLAGVKIGMLCGIATSIILFFKLGPNNSPIAASIAMIVPFVIIPIVSMFTKKPSEEIIKRAFKDIA